MALSIIIPSRTDSNLNACVDAIRSQGETARIIVVDDGLALRRPDVTYVSGLKPFIYARNINAGVCAAGTDNVFLLNDDAILETPGGIKALAWAAAKNPDYGIVAATCNNVGNPNQFPKGGGGLRSDERMVCFVAVYIPRSTLRHIGLLDERFVDYGLDDDDYSFRVRKAGLKIGIFDGCYFSHDKLTSTFRGGATNGGDYRPNLSRFVAKWGVDNWGRSA